MGRQYRKRPVVIEAHQWDGDVDALDIFLTPHVPGVVDFQNERLVIRTLEGDMEAGLTDWIIRGVEGELYPCKDSIFQASYEVVEEKL